MKKVLLIQSSLNDPSSASRKVAAEVIETLKRKNPGIRVIERDLAQVPVPHFTPQMVAAAFTPPEGRTNENKQTLKLSDELCAELIEADAIVIGAPMWNFSVPSVVKAWIDHLVRVGVTFKYTETGPVGMLPPGKVLYIAEASGGVYEGPSGSYNHVSPYLSQIFGFLGVTETKTIQIAGTAFRKEAAVEEGLAKAREI